MVCPSLTQPMFEMPAAALLRQALAENHRPSLRGLAVSIDAGVLRLSGMVGSFYEKQLCVEACRRAGVAEATADGVAVRAW